MKFFYYILLLVLAQSSLFAQTDTSVKNNVFAIKAMPFPIFYGLVFGYGLTGYLEKSISKKSSISLGYKYLEYMYGFSSNGMNKVLILDYKYFINRKKNESIYLSPYMKYRNLNFNETIESGIYGEYREKSLGVGLTLGSKESVTKSNRLTFDVFGGLGYFFKLDKEGRIYGHMVGPGYMPYEPDFIIHGFDLRIGALIGFNFMK